MGAEVPYKVKVRMSFEAEVTQYGVTSTDAAEKLQAAIDKGWLSLGHIDIDTRTGKLEVVEVEPK